jgi:hypothetical protein
MQLSLFYIIFTLCKLISYSTGLLELSNDAKLFMQMVHTRAAKEQQLDILESPAGCGCGHAPRGNALPPPSCPPVSLEELLTTQNELMRMLMENEARCGTGRP